MMKNKKNDLLQCQTLQMSVVLWDLNIWDLNIVDALYSWGHMERKPCPMCPLVQEQNSQVWNNIEYVTMDLH